MTFLTISLALTGAVLLSHAIYSAYEHSLLPSVVASHPPLPIDITFETLFSTLLLTVSVVLTAPALRPIRWSEWAGKIEREGWDPHAEGNRRIVGDTGDGLDPTKVKGGVGNPYRALEDRRGFWDVRTSRKLFANYIREGASAEQKVM